MKYILSQQIIFRTDDGVLWQVDSPDDVVALQESAARVLHCLLEHAGQVTTREEVFQQVWDKYNLQPSNNSLNQYIFAIRKALSGLGISSDIIQTIPKTGFFINAEEVTCQSEPNTGYDMPNVVSLRAMWARRVTRLVALAAAVILTFAGIHYFGTFNAMMFKQKLYPIGKLNQCTAYSLADNELVTRDELLKINDELASQPHLKMGCVANAFYIIYAEDRYILNNKGRRMASRCQYQPGNEYHLAQCKSVYIYEH